MTRKRRKLSFLTKLARRLTVVTVTAAFAHGIVSGAGRMAFEYAWGNVPEFKTGLLISVAKAARSTGRIALRSTSQKRLNRSGTEQQVIMAV
jgi:hypothetical protein